MSETPRMRDVLLPADLEYDATAAFAHAIKIALVTRGAVNTVHAVRPGEISHWTALPGVRAVLEGWGVLPVGATVAQYDALGIHVWFRTVTGEPVASVVHEALQRPTDLIVMMSHDHAQIERLVQGNVGESVARQAHTRTLWIPETAQRHIVSSATGAVTLHRVLIGVADDATQAAVDAAVTLAASLGVNRAHGILLNIGSSGIPALKLDSAWSWDNRQQRGSVVQGILDVADAENVDLIVLASRGHDSLLDMLRGSVTERVLHGALCPVLMAPVGYMQRP